jgi:adenylate cyclase
MHAFGSRTGPGHRAKGGLAIWLSAIVVTPGHSLTTDANGTGRIDRRLAAILAADIAGYSALMSADEEATVRDLRAHQTVLLPMVAGHGGRVIDTAGDGILAEFPSALGAVKCALAIQKTMAERNATVDSGRRMQFRIGVNLGDVIHDETRVYGDGVNIAARLESIAEPETILLSSKVYEEIQGKLDLVCDDLGPQALKNIARPVRVFAVSVAAIAALPTVPLATAAKPLVQVLPTPPLSIVVLPFAHLSAGSDEDYFADGLVEDITTCLSHFPRLFVIARNSAFTFKGRVVDVRQVGRELGVRYVLEGSVRKAANRVRVTGQLIDALTGSHVWANKFDGVLKDIFDLQDQITQSVVGAIEPRIMEAEIERARRKRPDSLDAYDLYLRALPEARTMTAEANARAVSLLEQALSLQCDYAAAAGLAAWCYGLRLPHNWWTQREVELCRGVDLGRLAIEKGPSDSDALAMGGYTIAFLGDELAAGLAAIERAIEFNPSSAQALTFAGWVRSYLGQAEAAVSAFKQAIRLSPFDPTMFRTHAGLAFAHLLQGHFEEAAIWGRRGLAENPNFSPTHRALAAALAHLGRIEEARTVVARLRELVPGLTVEKFARESQFKHSGRLPVVLEGLRLAGLPD